MHFGCLIILSLLLSSPKQVLAQPSFTTNGSADDIAENCYRLTSPKTANDVGSIWAEYPTQLGHAFEIRFAVNLGCSNYAGEGIAFVMHSDKTKYSAIGCADAAMGFAQQTGCYNYITPSLAVEFDTRFTKTQADIYVPHIALVQNGNTAQPLHKAVRMNSSGQEVRDCEYHSCRISWSPSTQLLQVYFEEELRLSYKGDISKIFGKEKNIYFGFTASSSTQANIQMVCIQSVDVSIDEEFDSRRSFEEGVGIFPNPLNERLTVNLNFDASQKVNIQLFNVMGKLIYEIPKHAVKNNQYHFNMPGLPSGVYYVTVSNGKNRVSRKLVHIASIRA
jgi:hypothetical protein